MYNIFAIRSEIAQILQIKVQSRQKAETGIRTGAALRGAAELKDGILNLPIKGPLSADDSFWVEFFGGVSYASIREALELAADDSEVKAIALTFDSPGGDVSGCGELAEYIKHYSANVKPVYAYVTGEACSAAYWLASATRKIVAHKSTMVGCIGTMVAIPQEEHPSKIIVSNLSPLKYPDTATEGGVAQIREKLDYSTELFVAGVAANRGTNPADVLAHYGQGDVVMAIPAEGRGMIDAVGNYTDFLRVVRDDMTAIKPVTNKLGSVTAKRNGKNKMRGRKMGRFKSEFVLVDSDAAGELPVVEVSVDVIKEQFPDIANALIEEGKTAANTENETIDEAAAEANMENPEEKELVAQLRGRKIEATAFYRELAKAKGRFVAQVKEQDPAALLRKKREEDGEELEGLTTGGEPQKRSGVAAQLQTIRKRR